MIRETLNARRLLCPLPVIRTQDKIKQMQPGDQLEVICTDPGVMQDIPAWSRIHGHTVLEGMRICNIKGVKVLEGDQSYK